MQISATTQSFVHSHSSHAAGKGQVNESKDPKKAENESSSSDRSAGPGKELSAEEKKAVTELAKRDREVRAHEAAHKAAAGQLAKGGASFDYQRGPDGKLYAVGGEVSISTGAVSGDPQATLRKAEQIRSAALAPGTTLIAGPSCCRPGRHDGRSSAFRDV